LPLIESYTIFSLAILEDSTLAILIQHAVVIRKPLPNVSTELMVVRRKMKSRSTSSKRNNRRGGAVAEAAITLPLFLLIVAASIELSTAIYLKESLTIAAFEGSRVAITRKANDDAVRNRVRDILNGRGISLGSQSLIENVTISPAADVADIMDPITITVSAPVAQNTVVPFRWLQFVTPEKLSATVVMRKEYKLETE
jgi:Flp pilus assembly protein TadG